MKQKKGWTIGLKPEIKRPVTPRGPAFAGYGRQRKIAMVGGAPTIRYTPWHDPSWEIWAHMSSRKQCVREPDVYFDLHPPELWREPAKKSWDPKYLDWVRNQRTPIYMQDVYPDVIASIRYPFESVITEFPRGYITNTVAWMIALALQQGVTHIGLFGCHYDSESEYGPQRGSAEYWCGVAEGRGVHVLIPPGCDLLNRPSLLYGYESHPNGVRDKSYSFAVNRPPAAPSMLESGKPVGSRELLASLRPLSDPQAAPLRDIGEPPALQRATAEGFAKFIADLQAKDKHGLYLQKQTHGV